MHPYVDADDELLIHPGQTVRLTLLMHPAGKVHLTSGVLPRKSLQLARDWVEPGLSVLAPSLRVRAAADRRRTRCGCPRSRRSRPTSSSPTATRRRRWKDDPILAATQSALLPDLPHQVQEGYIRIAPAVPDDAGGAL